MINVRKDLRGGRSIWADSPYLGVPLHTNPPRKVWDVVVVGAGITGSLVAHALSRSGHDVLVVDRRPPIKGSTMASTALVQWEIDVPLHKLAEQIGARRAFLAYRLAAEAVAKLGQLVSEERIVCGWRDREAVYLAGDTLGFRALQKEAAVRKKAGLSTRYVDGKAITHELGFERTGALVSQGAGEVDPARLTAGLLRRAAARATVIASPVEIVSVECGGGMVALADSDKRIHLARRAVFATGYETLRSIPSDAFSIISTWAIATSRLPSAALWPEKRIVWEASKPYLYVRTTSDGRIVAGGEDERFSTPARRDRLTQRKARIIARKLAELLPGSPINVDYAWAGCFAESPTGLAYIAEPQGYPGCLAILGSGGNGITFSVIAADIAKAWIVGQRHPAAHLFEKSTP